MVSLSKRVLVTGSRGFTGRHLCMQLMARGYEVIGLVRDSEPRPGEVSGDLGDRLRLATILRKLRPNVVIHLAAISFVGHGDPEAFYRINVLGTLNLLDALLDAALQPHAVLIASSANVYGNPAMAFIDETLCPHPVNHYACSKLAMEHLVRTYIDRLPIVLTRPFNYTGPGQSGQFLVAKIVEHFRRGARTIDLGNLEVVRDFSDVRRLVEAYIRLIDTPPVGATLNVCSGQGTSLREVVALMQDIAGYTIDVKVNPTLVRNNEIAHLVGNPGRLLKQVGELPAPSFRETLAWMYQQG